MTPDFPDLSCKYRKQDLCQEGLNDQPSRDPRLVREQERQLPRRTEGPKSSQRGRRSPASEQQTCDGPSCEARARTQGNMVDTELKASKDTVEETRFGH